MRWKSLSEDPSRAGVALSITLAAHAAAFYFLSIDLRTTRRASSANTQPALPITFLLSDLQGEEPLKPTNRKRPTSIAPVSSSAKSEPSVSISTLSERESAVVTDWHVAAAAAAAAAFNRSVNPQHRSLDSKPITIPKPEVYEKGLFDLGPAHKPGSIEDFGEGIVKTWVSHYCFELNPMAYAGLGGTPPLYPSCLRSKASYGGDDLFKSLTPKYLRKESMLSGVERQSQP